MPPQASFHQMRGVCVISLTIRRSIYSCSIFIQFYFCNFILWMPGAVAPFTPASARPWSPPTPLGQYLVEKANKYGIFALWYLFEKSKVL